MGDRSRWISESKASLDSIVSCRIARATQRYPALKDGERREREEGRKGEGDRDRQAGTDTDTQRQRESESQEAK